MAPPPGGIGVDELPEDVPSSSGRPIRRAFGPALCPRVPPIIPQECWKLTRRRRLRAIMPREVGDIPLSATRDPVSVRRIVLLWMHLLCAGAAAFVLIGHETPSLRYLFSGTLRGRGANGLFLAVPAIWQYVVSFVTSRTVVPTQRSYVAIYWVLLLVSTAAAIWVFATVEDWDLMLMASGVQAVAFIFASDRIADYDYRR